MQKYKFQNDLKPCIKELDFLYAETAKAWCTLDFTPYYGRSIEGVKLFSNREDREDFLEHLAGFE